VNHPAPTSASWLAPLFLLLAPLSWAGNHVVARAAAGVVPPWSLNLLRWLVVALLVGLFAARTITKDWPLIRRNWVRLLLLGASGGGLFGTLQYVALQHTGVINMGVLNSAAPALIVAAAVLLFRDRVRPLQALGIAISLAGVLAMVSRLDPARLAAFTLNRGDLLIIINMVIWALYSACLRLRPAISLISFLLALSFGAILVNVPMAIVEHLSGDVFPMTPAAWGAVLYAAIPNSIVAYLAWSRGVEQMGSTRAGVFLHLIPLANTAFGVALFGEELRLDHLVGFVLILTGVALTARSPR
jgi:drug/metabolite transporter (DMT)-like permease